MIEKGSEVKVIFLDPESIKNQTDIDVRLNTIGRIFMVIDIVECEDDRIAYGVDGLHFNLMDNEVEEIIEK